VLKQAQPAALMQRLPFECHANAGHATHSWKETNLALLLHAPLSAACGVLLIAAKFYLGERAVQGAQCRRPLLPPLLPPQVSPLVLMPLNKPPPRADRYGPLSARAQRQRQAAASVEGGSDAAKLETGKADGSVSQLELLPAGCQPAQELRAACCGANSCTRLPGAPPFATARCRHAAADSTCMA
jgi:hypothetical protein